MEEMEDIADTAALTVVSTEPAEMSDEIEASFIPIPKVIDDDTKLKILEALGSHENTYVEIAVRFGVSKSTVSRLSTEYGLQRKKSSQTQKPKKKKSVQKAVVDKLVQITDIEQPFLECGLVNDRHEMPVKLYIFDEALDEEIMFDYQRQEEHVRNFIETNIERDESGRFKKEIYLYATGLQAALAATIKVCKQLKINLTIKHWNAKTGKYNDQVMFKEFAIANAEQVKLYPFRKLLGSKEELFFYDCPVTKLNPDRFYLLKQVQYIKVDPNNMNIRTNIQNIRYIVAKDFDSIWKPYESLVKENISSRQDIVALSVFEMSINGGTSLQFGGGPLLKMYNYKTSNQINTNSGTGK